MIGAEGRWFTFHGVCPDTEVAVLGSPDIAAGFYAVEDLTSGRLDLYRVERPAEGIWAGRVFLKRIIDGRPVTLAGDVARRVLHRIEAGSTLAATVAA